MEDFSTSITGFTWLWACIFFSVLVVSLMGYFLPSIIAVLVKNQQSNKIFILNLFTGFTGFGWVAAFVWALLDVHHPKTKVQELKEYAELKDKGIITEDEFNTKKAKILET